MPKTPSNSGGPSRPYVKSGSRPGAKPGAQARSKAAKPEHRPASISPARRAAFAILALVAEGRGNSDDLLHGSHTTALSPEDRNLATTLVMGTLRWQIALDALIQPLLQRPDQRLAEPVAIALRLGAFQLLHLDRIPAHAALNESVELARANGQAHAAGMVNAILRNLTRLKTPGVPLHESTAAFARRLGHPEWMVQRWVAAYGRAAALRICEAGQAEPGEPVLFATEEKLPRIDDGSRLIAELAALALAAPRRIWDACAAPGGKTLVLSQRYPEAELLATDVSPRRLTAMRRRFEEAGAARITVEQADATAPAEQLEGYDLVLCDVPCSGTGTLARNPEIRLRLTPEEIARQASRQEKILAAALLRLAPGGRLVYSTCSLEPEECEQVVAEVMAKPAVRKAVRQLPLAPLLEALQASGRMERPLEGALRGETLRTLPGTHPGDGFFAALFERSGS